MHALDDLKARGFVAQLSDEAGLAERLSEGAVTVYAGFDPTASSLHVGHMLPILALRRLQAAGHRVIALVGGGTGRIGDPSFRTETRNLLDDDAIAANVAAIRGQLQRFLVLDGDRGLLVDNADWLLGLNYLEFLRDIGSCFSVNKMLTAEGYRLKMERGLSFIEFNYQLLQAFDFLELFRRHGCTLQIGGDDQWGNILPGVDLVRRKEAAQVFALTIPLLTTATGAKMGKTLGGAVWLDADRFSVFDFYQYWLNTDDRDVGRFLRLFTDLDEARIAALEALSGADVREAKRVLAHEVTALVHGAAAAEEAARGAAAMVAGDASEALPTHVVADAAGLTVAALLADAGLVKSRSEARRLIAGGCVKRGDGSRVDDPDEAVTADALGGEGLVLRVGKKRAVRAVLAG